MLREVKAGALTDHDAIERLERSRYWVWTAMDPERKLLLVIDVGTRTMAMAQRVVHHLVQMLAPDGVPLFVTDGFKDYALALPHRRLRQLLPEPEPTRGSGSLRRWQPVTPAMAARLTDHVWTTTELLSYRVPPHFLDTLPALERLYPPFEETHHGS